VVTKAVLTLVS